MNSSFTSRLVSNSKSGQKFKNIHTKWTDFKIIQVYLPFPCHQPTQYYPHTANFNIESLTCQLCCAWDKTSSHQTGNPCEGKILTLGSPSEKLFSAMFININLKDIIVLDYFYMIGNHHSLQLIKISFETNYTDQYERIIEDPPVWFTHNH